MTNVDPVLQRINRQANVFNLEPADAAATRACGVGLIGRPDGYSVVTSISHEDDWWFPYGMLNLMVQVEDGMQATTSPTRVEFAPSPPFGAMPIRIESVQKFDEGKVVATGRAYEPAKREDLLLPGDPGFDLFEELHSQVQGIGAQVRSLIGMLGVSGASPSFYYHPYTNAYRYDTKTQVATHTTTHYYGFGAAADDPEQLDMLQLHMITAGAQGSHGPDAVNYNSGTLHLSEDFPFWKGHALFRAPGEPLGADMLVAFSTLNRLILDLVVAR